MTDASLKAATRSGNSFAELEVRIRLELDRFDLDLDFKTSSQVTGVFGASGSGKTSLLETIAGLRRQARGKIRLGDEIWLDGGPRSFVRPENRHVGLVPQDGLLFPHQNVLANLLAGSRRALSSGQALEETLASVTELLELRDLLERRVTTLSGGERQRVALGRALCSGARLLLLDEPLASLDLPLRRKLLPFLRRVRTEFAIPMLVVSHDPLEVQALCDDLVVLRDGVQIARGEPREVLTDPDVFPLAEVQGFENILPCRFLRTEGGTCVVGLGGDEQGAGGVELALLEGSGTPGRELLVGIPAHEIMIATHKPSGLSARNILPATISDLRTVGSLGLVTVELAPSVPPLTIEVTETSFVELGLEAGGEIFLVVKAASCRLYDDAGTR